MATRARRKTPPRNQPLTAPPPLDATTKLPRIPIDLDLFAQGVDLDRAITAAHDDGHAAAETQTHYGKARHRELLAYALADIATRWPGFMHHYYAVAGQRIFTPPDHAAPTDATVELPALPALPSPPAQVSAEVRALSAVPQQPLSQPVAGEIVDAELVDDITVVGIPTGMRPSFEHDEATADDFFAPKEVEGVEPR